MKKLNYKSFARYAFLAIFAMSFAACDKSFLEDSGPKGALDDATLANETGVDLLLTGAYSSLDGVSNFGAADWHISGDNWWVDVISDDAHKGSTDGDQADLFLIETFQWATGNPYFFGKWRALFAGVNRANSVIAQISKIQNPSAAVTIQHAEARFLRAHFNFELKKLFDNVPKVTEENFMNNEYALDNEAGKNRLEWADIASDFTFAKDNLPCVRSSSYSQSGRPLCHAAKVYLGKTHLYAKEYAEALPLFKAVIDSGAYALLGEYVDNFKSTGENGSESVFAIQFAADDGSSAQGNRGGTLNYPIGAETGYMCCGFYQPTQDLVDTFKTDANGLPLLDTFQAEPRVTSDYGINSDEDFTPFSGHLDPRIDYTVGRRGIEYNGFGPMKGKSWVRAGFGDISGPYISKKNIFWSDDDVNKGTGGWGEQRSGINYHFIRYSDVLLMAAEAAAEIGGTNNLDLAMSYVNQVRKRAKDMTVADSSPNYMIELYTSFPNQAYARKAVRFERRLELGMEGHRFFDLVRWGVLESVMTQYIVEESKSIPPFDKNQVVEPKHNRMPIPLRAIDSNPLLKQNDNY